MDKEEVVSKNFIEKIIDQDLEEGKYAKIAIMEHSIYVSMIQIQ